MRTSGIRAFAGGRGKRPEALLLWLNHVTDQGPLGKPSKASRTRVSTLLREIIETETMLADAEAEDPNFDFFDLEHASLNAKVAGIQVSLDSYPKWPTVEIAYRDSAAVLHIEDASGPGRALGEQLAVWDIAYLTNSGDIAKVRQCGCAQWYYAKRAEQKACSPRCRHKTYEQTEPFKAKRRVYMRDYYKLKQSGKVK